jgi:hypothetical protein
MTPCPVCAIPLSTANRETCPSPACPCYGLRSDSDDAQRAALRWRSRHSVAAARTWDGANALAHLEAQSWLDMQEARGELISVMIEHADADE